ncbi:hypothetical protein LZ31DRAFT_393533 [Colletotrichum somersetense]|nr:hypothetical protein LZ31DRAFT_393533 [Colletotrichum somersetense]
MQWSGGVDGGGPGRPQVSGKDGSQDYIDAIVCTYVCICRRGIPGRTKESRVGRGKAQRVRYDRRRGESAQRGLFSHPLREERERERERDREATHLAAGHQAHKRQASRIVGGRQANAYLTQVTSRGESPARLSDAGPRTRTGFEREKAKRRS